MRKRSTLNRATTTLTRASTAAAVMAATLALAAGFGMASCHAAPAEEEDPGQSESSHLTAEGWGPLRIGMTRDEVVAAAGEDANPDLVGGPEPEVCDQFRPERAPEGMLVMIERGQLTRISVAHPAEVTTDGDLGVGTPAEEVAAAHGDAAVRSPHKYIGPPAEYITVWSTDPSEAEPRGIVYETGTDGRVTHIHAGGPSIRYVEGCL